MQAIDNSNLLGYNANFNYAAFVLALAFTFNNSSKVFTFTDTTATPAGTAVKHINIQIHDEFGNTAYASIKGKGGEGYTSAPTVGITGGGGTGGAVTAIINASGHVTGFTITNAGSGYSTAPTIAITGGGGSGATATATVSGGAITAVTLSYAGTTGNVDVSSILSPNKTYNVTATVVLNNGWVATGIAAKVQATGVLGQWNKTEAPAQNEVS